MLHLIQLLLQNQKKTSHSNHNIIHSLPGTTPWLRSGFFVSQFNLAGLSFWGHFEYTYSIQLFALLMASQFRLKFGIVVLEIFDLVSFLVFVTGVVLFIRFFIFNPYTVVGQSMEPVFSQWDFIIVDKITPKLGELERWNIVVFVPENWANPFIKRIVGLPGETVKIREGNVYICEAEETEINECEHLKEYYLPNTSSTNTTMCGRDTFSIGSEWYFVLWDNRDHSTDSRCCFWLACHENANYLVYDKDLIGKVAVKVYPKLEPYW